MAASRFAEDLQAEPGRLRAMLARLLGPERSRLEEAARALRDAPYPWIAGMGSSFHGGFAVQAFFDAAGRPARNAEAGELVHFARIAPRSTLLILSRSGRSVEVVELAKQASAGGSLAIAVTNDPESPLAKESRITVNLGAPFDFNVTVAMYSGIALGGALAAAMAVGAWDERIAGALDRAIGDVERTLATWRELAARSAWCSPPPEGAPTILLARGAGLAAALETRQLFEEAAKLPATALTTGAFRHGPNEIVRPGCRVLLWLPADGRLRALDLGLAADLRKAGAQVALIGSDLPRGSADLALELPAWPDLPASWRFLFEIVPARFLVEAVASARGVDCDRFEFCPFVVESEEGLRGGSGPAER